jgi:hypothetical protein
MSKGPVAPAPPITNAFISGVLSRFLSQSSSRDYHGQGWVSLLPELRELESATDSADYEGHLLIESIREAVDKLLAEDSQPESE